MSALKSVIITLPAKAATAPTIIDKTAASKLNFTTSILMDKIKVESAATQQQQQPSKKQLPVPSPLKHMELDGLLFKQESNQPSRGKKRRLDHLTWEEKLQRKKLKNRVAAQTSRDRKKAKLDELEDAVRQLREQNERLTKECSILRMQNESLVTETRRLKQDNKELMELKERKEEPTATTCATCQARVGCTVPALGSAVSLKPSAAGWHSTDGTSSDPELKRQHTPEDPDALPPLEDLFSELQADDDYIERLEELAESLLREVTAEVETNPPQSNEQSPVKKESTERFDNTEKMVGQTPNYVEADTSGGSVAIVNPTTQNIPKGVTSIVPTVTLNSSGPITIAENIEIKEEPMHDAEMVYGTYDEATNCITIIYPEDEVITRLSPNSIPIQSKQLLASPSHSYDSMSPASLHSDDADVAAGKLDSTAHSDGGYESHGSPASSDVAGANNALTDLWHESFSELFPSLA
ncbi:LOW QUALITY PROTEIN: uncharacterized protein LOC116417701 [Nasonia vitripennis]|uniref:X-box-binding protein 1 n=1 Tax=Nasonia vitripennis TaxID=7425 RepID=A0A7M7QL74_NASVI|nr:LOW QUALITY PROTEIN: uncharacterized protein LOC116417701 [Nasonia vitripennis]